MEHLTEHLHELYSNYETVIEFIDNKWYLRKHRQVEPMFIKLDAVLHILQHESNVFLVKG